MTPLFRSAELGAASGLRSLAAPSQLSRDLARSRGRRPQGAVAELLSRQSASPLLQIAVVGEMLADKFPVIPNRIDAAPLFGRAFLGGVSGGILAQRHGESGALGAVLGAAAAVLSAYAGFYGRRALTRSIGLPDAPVALCEDAVAIALARHALRA